MQTKIQLINTKQIEDGVRLILAGIGDDPRRVGLLDTPRRVAQMYQDFLSPSSFEPTAFANSELYDQMVIIREIPFFSICEHHLLPFFGNVTLGYIPAKTYLGLSKLARIVDRYARSLQVQERLTTEIAQWIERTTFPLGVGVIVKARHLCMEMRGVEKVGSETITSAMLGVFRDDAAARAEFLSLARC